MAHIRRKQHSFLPLSLWMSEPHSVMIIDSSSRIGVLSLLSSQHLIPRIRTHNALDEWPTTAGRPYDTLKQFTIKNIITEIVSLISTPSDNLMIGPHQFSLHWTQYQAHYIPSVRTPLQVRYHEEH